MECYIPVSQHRYTYEISFVGHDVVGNVETLTETTGNPCTSILVSGGGTSAVTITTINEGEALGTGTTTQNVTVSGLRCGSCCG